MLALRLVRLRRSARSVSLRSPLGRVLGLGAAKAGVHHWWSQRLTSVALVPLAVWFVVSLLRPAGARSRHRGGVDAQGSTALLLILFLLVAAWHSQLGVQVVVEDYVHGHGVKRAHAACWSASCTCCSAAAGVFAVLSIAFGVAA